MDYRPPGSSVQGISQARTLEWVTIFFSRGSCWPRDGTCVSCILRQVLYQESHQESPNHLWSNMELKKIFLRGKKIIWLLLGCVCVSTREFESRVLKRFVRPCSHSQKPYNSQKVGSTQVSIKEWIDMQNMIYTPNVVSFKHKREGRLP